MQTDNPIVSDFVKLLNSAAGTLAGVGREGRDAARERAREIFGGLDFVSREEFEAVKALATTAREHADKLEARVTALEASGPGRGPVTD